MLLHMNVELPAATRFCLYAPFLVAKTNNLVLDLSHALELVRADIESFAEFPRRPGCAGARPRGAPARAGDPSAVRGGTSCAEALRRPGKGDCAGAGAASPDPRLHPLTPRLGTERFLPPHFDRIL